MMSQGLPLGRSPALSIKIVMDGDEDGGRAGMTSGLGPPLYGTVRCIGGLGGSPLTYGYDYAVVVAHPTLSLCRWLPCSSNDFRVRPLGSPQGAVG